MNKALSPPPCLPVNHRSYSFLLICYRHQASDQVSKSVCTLWSAEQTCCRHFHSQKSLLWLPTTKAVGLACKRNFFQSHIPIHTNTRVWLRLPEQHRSSTSIHKYYCCCEYFPFFLRICITYESTHYFNHIVLPFPSKESVHSQHKIFFLLKASRDRKTSHTDLSWRLISRD